MSVKSSDRLPAGWTVQFKALKTGRKIKYYMNQGTGEKFFSKEDLLRYVKVKSTLHEPKPTSGSSRRHLENCNAKSVAKGNEHPEWLPDGWAVESKIRKSGSLIGRSYKIYIDPLTKHKFFSKPEVLRYLESLKQKNGTSKWKETHKETFSASKVVDEKSTVDDLPPGWIKDVKIRKTAYGIKKDPYYTDSVSGYVFRSKKGVFRYLETGEISRHAFKPAKREINDVEPLSLFAAKTQKLEHPVTRRQLFPVEENSEACNSALPAAEASRKRSGKRVSAETGLAGATTAEISPEKTVILKGAEAKETSTSALSKHTVYKRNEGNTTFPADVVSTPAPKSLQGKNLLQSGMECSNKKLLGNSNKSKNDKKVNLPRRLSRRLAGHEPELVVDCVSIIARVPKRATAESCKSEAFSAAGLTSNDLADEISKKLNAGPLIEVSNFVSSELKIPSNGEQLNEIKPFGNKSIPGQQMQKLKSTETNDKSELHLSFSFDNSCLDPCLEFAFQTLTGEIPVDGIPDNGPVSTPAADILEGKNLQETTVEKSSDLKNGSNSIKSKKKKKKLNFPRRSSKRLAGFEPELVPNSMFSERALLSATRKSHDMESHMNAGLYPNGVSNVTSQWLEDGYETAVAHHDSTDISIPLHEESSTNSKKQPLEVQTVSEEQPQKLEIDKPERQPQQLDNEKMNNENSESPLVFPFADSWSDPCLEFAVKTLTGAIPVDDHLAIQDYFQHQLDTSRTQADNKSALHDFGFPSSFQTDVSFQFDAPEKQTASQQQLPVSPSFLPSGNISFPSCSSVASQPSLEGSKDLQGKVKS